MSTTTDPAALQRTIYFFGNGQADGSSDLKSYVGGKGASLAEMTRAQLNVPPGFTISSACCAAYYAAGKQWPAGLEDAVRAAMTQLEQLVGRTFGVGGSPLLVAVRSGAEQSMPGMMDTVLNVGLNPACVRAMAERTSNPRAAWEAYRHFLGMFGHTVGGVDEAIFTALIAEMLHTTGKSSEADLSAAEMEELCTRMRAAYQQHTGRELPTAPYDMLFQAIDAVFGSWHNERAILYRKHHRIDGLLGTAVNVQMMCPSEVSGVLFTANPVNPKLGQIIVESSYGLGEAVVLGKVTPDRFVLQKEPLAIQERNISDKRHVIATLAENGQDQSGARDGASLNDAQIVELAQLGLRVESYFKFPCDVEWALSGGRFYLLQARAIKGAQVGNDDAELAQLRQREIAQLQALAEPQGTVWSRFNLAEILPEPTPMTWAIVRRFMSGQGGYGLMYRDLGFDPDPALDEIGDFDLICGRTYCNLSREPKMLYRNMPFEHSFALLKQDPTRAIYPKAQLNPRRGGWRFWLRLPLTFFQLFGGAVRVRHLKRTFAERFRQEILPAYLDEVRKEEATDWTKLSPAQLLDRLAYWRKRALEEFARDSLKPTALADMLMNDLEAALLQVPVKRAPGERPMRVAAAVRSERAKTTVRLLTMGAHPEAGTDLAAAVRDLALGNLSRADLVERFGHRGSNEMELAQPRWSEDSAALERMAAHPVHQQQHLAEEQAAAPLEAFKLTPLQRTALEHHIQQLHTYLGLRETAKHYLMKGYALLRQILVELDRRYGLDGGIFYLTPEELPVLIAGSNLKATIAQRRRERELLLRLPMPQVLFSDDLEAIGRQVALASAETLQGTPLSAGVAEGPALVLLEPTAAVPESEPYILVCPSTDPAWLPLFVRARGIIMETGGVLSHGAIVAREFGLPAIAGLADIHRRLRTGQRLHMDGSTGKVNVLA